MLSPLSAGQRCSSVKTPDRYHLLCDAFPDPFPFVPLLPSPKSEMFLPKQCLLNGGHLPEGSKNWFLWGGGKNISLFLCIKCRHTYST